MDRRVINRRDFLKLLGVSPLLFTGWPRWRYAPRVKPQVGRDLPNILILVFDALSAANMSLYGYPRQTTPNIERFAKRATVFHRHYSGGNFTTPGTASLLTGVYPWTHRAMHIHGEVERNYFDRSLFALLAPLYNSFVYSHNPMVNILFHHFRQQIDQFTPISELCMVSNTYVDKLFDQDFQLAFMGETLALRGPNFVPSTLFVSQFDRAKLIVQHRYFQIKHRDTFPRGIPNYYPGVLFFTLEQTMDWLRKQLETQPQPYLGYIHVLPPHAPYATRSEFVNVFDDGWQPAPKPESFFSDGYSEQVLLRLRREYDEFIAYTDAEFGRLYDYIDQVGLLDNTILIVTSDHGEMFERGIFEHITPALYDPVMRVPLLISQPGQRQREDVQTLSHAVDLLPTLLDMAGLPLPDWTEGEILSVFTNQPIDPERSAYVVEAKENPKTEPLTKASVALLKGRYKLIRYFGYEGYRDKYELYDLEADPEEMQDLYDPGNSISVTLQEELNQKLAEANRPFSGEGERLP